MDEGALSETLSQNDDDDETIEFEIDVISSASNNSLANEEAPTVECQLDVSHEAEPQLGDHKTTVEIENETAPQAKEFHRLKEDTEHVGVSTLGAEDKAAVEIGENEERGSSFEIASPSEVEPSHEESRVESSNCPSEVCQTHNVFHHHSERQISHQADQASDSEVHGSGPLGRCELVVSDDLNAADEQQQQVDQIDLPLKDDRLKEQCLVQDDIKIKVAPIGEEKPKVLVEEHLQKVREEHEGLSVGNSTPPPQPESIKYQLLEEPFAYETDWLVYDRLGELMFELVERLSSLETGELTAITCETPITRTTSSDLVQPKIEVDLDRYSHGPSVDISVSRVGSDAQSPSCDEDELLNFGVTEDEDYYEDLEREIDEEPEFVRREVVIRKNQNPRDEYSLGDELGRGKFGTVYRCTEHSSGRQLAAKFIAMRRREDREDVEREVAIMSVLQHKRLLQLYDAFDDGHQEMCLITELVEGGELFERIVNDDFDLTERKAAIFMRQICEGVDYMHSQNIVHLDMKPENILCLSRSSVRIKLIDFGLARRLEPERPIRVMFGTPDFAAPEVLGYETVSLATDMWSVGVICYVLLSGLSPFMGDNDMDTMANVTRAAYDFNDQAFEPISELAKDFISKLLVRVPERRLKPSECLAHPWLARGGGPLEAAVRERRESSMSLHRLALEQVATACATAGANSDQTGELHPPSSNPSLTSNTNYHRHHRPSIGAESTASSGLVSLDKRRLKRYVVRRKWHKTVHAIMALNRMGANLNKLR